jgi:hypothetical protein
MQIDLTEVAIISQPVDDILALGSDDDATDTRPSLTAIPSSVFPDLEGK